MTLPPGTDDLIERALAEDLGTAGDLTTAAVVPVDARTTARIVARHEGRIAGLEVALRVFTTLDDSVEARILLSDGSDVHPGDTIAELTGPTRALLTGERVALNLLGHLSGVATATRDLVALVAGTGTRVADTRKTLPGLRALEKEAVRIGGGINHRFGLYDAVMIKDNHIAAVGSITDAVKLARDRVGHTVIVEVEADTPDQAAEAVAAGADVVLLDNMDLDTMRAAVKLIGGRAIVEASGGIDADTIGAVAATGVDVISVGAITHSASSLDVGLDF